MILIVTLKNLQNRQYTMMKGSFWQSNLSFLSENGNFMIIRHNQIIHNNNSKFPPLYTNNYKDLLKSFQPDQTSDTFLKFLTDQAENFSAAPFVY